MRAMPIGPTYGVPLPEEATRSMRETVYQYGAPRQEICPALVSFGRRLCGLGRGLSMNKLERVLNRKRMKVGKD
jgi:hypothetical protein